jgi:hypothetical protein
MPTTDSEFTIYSLCIIVSLGALSSRGINLEDVRIPTAGRLKMSVKGYLPAKSDAPQHKKCIVLSCILTIMVVTFVTSAKTVSNKNTSIFE